MPSRLDRLAADVRRCTLCKAEIPQPPRPILQVHRRARILIAGQAPGRLAHDSQIPFNDPSGRRLRDWLGIDDETFYDRRRVAILPMAFCFPGSGKSGDLAPMPRCAATWRDRLLAEMVDLRLTLVIGQYALRWHLPERRGTLTQTVSAWREIDRAILPLPHPSPRNNRWLAKNRWFETELLPELRIRVRAALK